MRIRRLNLLVATLGLFLHFLDSLLLLLLLLLLPILRLPLLLLLLLLLLWVGFRLGRPFPAFSFLSSSGFVGFFFIILSRFPSFFFFLSLSLLFCVCVCVCVDASSLTVTSLTALTCSSR